MPVLLHADAHLRSCDLAILDGYMAGMAAVVPPTIEHTILLLAGSIILRLLPICRCCFDIWRVASEVIGIPKLYNSCINDATW